MRGKLGLVMAGVVVGLVAACGDSDDGDATPTPEGVQGQAGLCADLALVRSSLEQVTELNASSSVEEAEDARDALNLAITELQEAESDAATNQIAALQDAFESFDSDLDAAASQGGGTSELGDAAAADLQASATQMSATEEEIRETAGCPAQ
jgi:ElaB/YqjD/DUF883 family membrane-anchored ribosome-binding protein